MEKEKTDTKERARNIIHIIWRREKTRPILIRNERDASANGERDISLSLSSFPRVRDMMTTTPGDPHIVKISKMATAKKCVRCFFPDACTSLFFLGNDRSRKKLKHLPHTRSRLHSRPKITVPSILAIIRWLFSPNCPTYFSTTKAFFFCCFVVPACQLAARILKILSLGFSKIESTSPNER